MVSHVSSLKEPGLLRKTSEEVLLMFVFRDFFDFLDIAHSALNEDPGVDPKLCVCLVKSFAGGDRQAGASQHH